MRKDNVIDMTDRIQEPDFKMRLKHLKVRLDLEHAKVAVSTSLLSILVLVTLANHRMISSDEARPQVVQSRNIASVSTGTSEVEDTIVHSLAAKDLSSQAAVGRKPSSLEQLSFGFFEGKYAVHMQNGKLSEIEFANAVDSGDRPKHIEDLAQFLDSNREVLPVAFARSVKTEHSANSTEILETYQLLNEISRPVANVQFRMDSAGRLLSMKVAQLGNLASK